MKQLIYSLLIFILFFLMLLFPQSTFHGAYNGLMLWFETLLPTLLPFIIFSNFLIKTNLVTYLSRILHPVLGPFFCVTPLGSYAILIGFLCGYPMGAKIISDMVHSHKISLQEGKYLLSFCNNTSPMFLLGFVISQCFKSSTLTLPVIIIFYLSPILCSFIFRCKYKIKNITRMKNRNSNESISFNFTIFDTSIMNGFETITKIGGYIILFSILFTLFEPMNLTFFLPFLEVTNGIPIITNLHLTFPVQFIIIMASLSFGGLCALAQTYSMIQESGLSLISYIKEKLITTMVTSLLAFLYVYFILR